MFKKINKKGAGEVFSWAAGLILIFVLVIVVILAYNLGGLGKKADIEIVLSSGEYSFHNSLANQRIGAALLMSDFSSSEKGELLGNVYSSYKGEAAFGKSVDEFIKMISYDYFGLVIGQIRVVVRTQPDSKDVAGCGVWDDVSSFYLPTKKQEYSNVGVLVRECKNA